jgi:hypothetical protein
MTAKAKDHAALTLGRERTLIDQWAETRFISRSWIRAMSFTEIRRDATVILNQVLIFACRIFGI